MFDVCGLRKMVTTSTVLRTSLASTPVLSLPTAATLATGNCTGVYFLFHVNLSSLLRIDCKAGVGSVWYGDLLFSRHRNMQRVDE
jgi:hypothetical protein